MRVARGMAAGVWAVCVASSAVGCGDDPAGDSADLVEDASSTEDVAAPDALGSSQVVSLRTVLSAPATAASEAIRVICEATDAAGAVVSDVATEIEVRPPSGWRREGDDQLIGFTANDYDVVCVAPSLGLRAAAAPWQVRPGPAVETRAVATPAVVEAGTPTAVTCEAWDVGGNLVSAAEAMVTASLVGEGVQVDDRTVTVTVAGRYWLTCQLAGAEAVGEALLEVRPGPPAQLLAAVAPPATSYGVGDVVALEALATDAFDNVAVGAVLRWAAQPPLPGFGEGRFVAAEEGRYTLSVEVEGPTHDDQALHAEAEILVDGAGPSITCESPALGEMLLRSSPVTLTGRVADVAGVKTVTVDGQSCEVRADGSFSSEVTPGWGVNVHEVVAEDQVGHTSSTFCAYLAADAYLPEDAPLLDAIAVELTADAVDDGPPSQPLSSLTDLLRLVLSSDALVDTLHTTMLAANPVVPNACRKEILGWCALEVGAEYRGLALHGPHTLTATLVEGGLRVRAVIRNLDLSVQLIGDLDNEGDITVDHITLDLTFGIGLSGGQPEVWVASTNEVTVGGIDADFEGAISGTIIDLVFDAFEDTIRDEVAAVVRDYLNSELDAMLGEILASYDLASVGGSFSVPQLGDAAPLSLGLALGWSTLEVSPERLRIGLSTTVTGPTGQAAASLGVPLPPTAEAAVPSQSAFTSQVALGMLNQMLHRLWRGGLFHFDDLSSLSESLPEGTDIALALLAPPAAEGVEGVEGGAVDIHFGPLVGSVMIPGLVDAPLGLRMTAKVRAAVRIADGVTLDFGGDAGLDVVDLHVAFAGLPMPAATRAALEAQLQSMVEEILDQTLGAMLPTLPIPDFALPEGFEAYGVPAGTVLGLRDAELDTTHDHFSIGGRFGQ